MKAAVANCAWLAAGLPAWLSFKHALGNPGKTQRGILRRLLATNALSAYGRTYRFEAIRTYEEFREQVPVVDYEALEPWIVRIMEGEQSVLTTEPITRLLPTSGSSGGRKLIPFTRSYQQELNAAISPWMIDLARQHPSITLGPAYWSISPALQHVTEAAAVPIGFEDDSAYVGGWRQALVGAALAVPSALRLVEDVEMSRYLTLLCLLRRRDLRLVSVWHPSFLTLLLDRLEVHWEELIADIKDGGCSRSHALPAEVRRAVDARPLPARAAELRRRSWSDIHAIWPHLQVVSCWGDGQAGPALAALQARLPGVNIQPKGQLATEAFVSVPFRGYHPVAINSHFYEFADKWGGLVLAHELEKGEVYEVLVTTAAGLWRYRLGDLVQVDGFVDSTPSLQFLGRAGSVSDLCGEKLAEVFVTRAIAEACKSQNCSPSFAMLAPEVSASGLWNYSLFVEGEIPAGLARRVDEELRGNPHYRLCRDLGQLGSVKLFPITRGAYEKYCEVCMMAGQRSGDIKPRALSAMTDWRERFAPAGSEGALR